MSPDGKGVIVFAKTGGKEGYNVDNLHGSGGRGWTAKKLSAGPHSRNYSHFTKVQLLLLLLKYIECLCQQKYLVFHMLGDGHKELQPGLSILSQTQCSCPMLMPLCC